MTIHQLIPLIVEFCEKNVFIYKGVSMQVVPYPRSFLESNVIWADVRHECEARFFGLFDAPGPINERIRRNQAEWKNYGTILPMCRRLLELEEIEKKRHPMDLTLQNIQMYFNGKLKNETLWDELTEAARNGDVKEFFEALQTMVYTASAEDSNAIVGFASSTREKCHRTLDVALKNRQVNEYAIKRIEKDDDVIKKSEMVSDKQCLSKKYHRALVLTFEQARSETLKSFEPICHLAEEIHCLSVKDLMSKMNNLMPIKKMYKKYENDITNFDDYY
ncbi:unnamed protein product [Caenorhabditis bovis]|nr:unnamed protein product [Caenorhabditis bovis]